MNHRLSLSSKLIAIGLAISPPIIGSANLVHATGTHNQTEVDDHVAESFEITDQQFLEGVETAYETGQITESDYQMIRSELNQRVGVKGVTKIVSSGNGTVEIYLNSKHAGLLVGAGKLAAAAAIVAIPGVKKWVAANGMVTGTLGLLLGDATSNLTDTSNGIIITAKNNSEQVMPDGSVEKTWRVTGVRDQ